MIQRLLLITGHFVLSVLFAAQIQVQAQNQLFGPANNVAIVREISPDGRYVVGQTIQGVGSAGYVWDSQAGNNTITVLAGRGEAYGVTNDRLVVGVFDDPDFEIEGNLVRSGGYSQSGTAWSSLGAGLMELPLTNLQDGSFARRISADGKVIVGMSGKYSGGKKLTVPYAWKKNADDQWIGEEWTYPENIQQGVVIDVSADGNTAIGYVHDGNTRMGILWKSGTEYELPLTGEDYSEYLCISPNGVYAGFTYAGQSSGRAGIHNLETGEITMIPQGFLINDISDDGFAVGAYKSPAYNVDKAYVYSEELGFMDFGEFVTAFASDLDIVAPNPLALAFDSQTNRRYSVNAITPDGLSFAINLPADRVSNFAYILKLGTPVVILPYPANLTANVSVPDRNKATLTWEAPEIPESSDKILTGYLVYRDNAEIAQVNPDVLTYTDENIPVGYHEYTVKGIYGAQQSRTSNTVRVTIVDNYDLPFHENFDSLDLTANYWEADLELGGETRVMWDVYYDAGVEYGTGLMLLVNNFYGVENKQYATSFISKYLDARDAKKVYMSFLARPNYYPEPELTPDTLFVDVYNGEEWITVNKSSFQLISEWKAEMIDLSPAAAGKLFKMRLRMTGANYTVSAKYIHFDDITISATLPEGDAVPQNILYKKTGDTVRLAWQQNAASQQYALTYANSPMRSAIGDEGKSFIAANSFDAEDLAIYDNLYLTSVTAYINKTRSDSPDPVLKLAVFEDNTRIVSQEISGITVNAWNTFPLETPVLLNNKNLKIGIEVIEHASNELPVGVDGKRNPATGKGDLYSEDGGENWETLTGAGILNNWCIIGNVTEEEYAGTRDVNIVGYNIYKEGVRLNEDLVFGQNFVTGEEGCFTVRAYSLASGISAASEETCVEQPSFTIAASAGEGGTISPQGNVTVNQGGKQTFTFTPDKDYEIAGVVVDGTNTATAKNYTFNNVKENHTIAVTFQKKLEIKTVVATPRLSVYPNPTKGEIHIKNRSKIENIQVFDVIGKLRREINNINDTETIVDLSSFPKGIYILKMDGETIKVIKQ
jgi:uncharacterized membrane protein